MNPRKKGAMLKAFHAFSVRIAEEYARAEKCLEEDDYLGALDILSALTTSHAKTTLSLRGALTRNGAIPEETQ